MYAKHENSSTVTSNLFTTHPKFQRIILRHFSVHKRENLQTFLIKDQD